MKPNKIVCLYRILNTVNGKFYIGSSMNWYKRKYHHRRSLNRGEHHSPPLQRAWDKYGEESFRFEIIEDLSGIEEEIVRSIEWWYLNNTNCIAPDGYNCSNAPSGSPWNNPESKHRILDGIAAYWATPESRLQCSAAQKKRFSDPEQLKQHSDAVKKSFEDPARQQKNLDMLYSPEVQAKLHVSKSEEHKQKISAGNTGKKRTEEMNKANSEQKTQLYKDPELCKKVSNGVTIYFANNPEAKTNLSNKSKSLWQDPEWAKKCKEARKAVGYKPLGKPVSQYKDGILIATFPSIAEAARSLGLTNGSHIISVINGKRKHCKGFQWLYV